MRAEVGDEPVTLAVEQGPVVEEQLGELAVERVGGGRLGGPDQVATEAGVHVAGDGDGAVGDAVDLEVDDVGAVV